MNQKGVSLIEVVVGTALTGMMGFFVAQFFRDQQKMGQEMTTDHLVHELRTNLMRVFQNPTSCALTVGNGQVTLDTSGRVIHAPFVPGGNLNSLRSSRGVILYSVGVPFDNNRFQIDSISTTLFPESSAMAVDIRVLDLRKTSFFSSNRFLPSIQFELDVSLHPNTNHFIACSADTSDTTKFCNGKGAVYNAVTDQCMILGGDVITPPMNTITFAGQSLSFDMDTGQYKFNYGQPFSPGYDCEALMGKGHYFKFTSDGRDGCQQFRIEDVDDLIDTNFVNCTSKPYRSIVKAGGKFKLTCDSGSGACLPPPSCPPPWNPNMSLDDDILNHNMSWTWNPSLAAILDVATNLQSCRLALRTTTACTGQNEFRICDYSDSSASGCNGHAYDVAPSGPPPCPSRGTTFKLLGQTVQTGWSLAGNNPLLTFVDASGVLSTSYSCTADIRSTTVTQEFRRCSYQNYYALGCNYGGDADCNGLVNNSDAVTIGDYIMGSNPTPSCPTRMDVNSSGNIEVGDIMGVIQIINGTYPPPGW